MPTHTTTTTTRDVFLFIPNLIGYLRLILTMTSLLLMILMPKWWILAIILYLGSFVGDLFDGMAARYYHQTSTFGGLMDMVTDRCSTLGLLFVLYGEYGNHDAGDRMLFLSLALLDIASHWCQMYSTAALQIHHKSEEGNANRFFLVRWYYQHFLFFGYCCVGAELTYVILYVLSHISAADYPTIATLTSQFLWFVCIPACAIKQIVNIFQLCSACAAVASHDAELRNQSLSTATKNTKSK